MFGGNGNFLHDSSIIFDVSILNVFDVSVLNIFDVSSLVNES